MKFLSSIFSFDTLHVRWGKPRGLMLALTLLAALEFGVSRADWAYRLTPKSSVGLFLSIERDLKNGSDPRVVIMGDSRAKLGFLPQVMEKELGLPEGAVVNLAMNGGDVYDAWLLRERNREKLKRARLLIYGVDDWQFNGSIRPGERFKHFASLPERWRMKPGWDTLLSWLWRTTDKQKLLRRLPRQIGRALSKKQKTNAATGDRERRGDADDEDARRNKIAYRVTRWYENYALSSPQRDYLEALARSAKHDGQQVLVVQVPLNDDYLREVHATHAADYEAYKQFINALHPIPVIFFEEGTSCGLQTSDFKDYGHPTSGGATNFTRFFTTWLRTSHPEMAAVAQSPALTKSLLDGVGAGL